MIQRRTVLLALVLLVVFGFPSFAQTTHPYDPNAQIVGMFSGNAPITAAVSETHYEIIVWLLGSGEYDYQFEVGKLAFNGTDGCIGLNLVSLSDIADAVASHAISRGVSLGFPLCGVSPSGRRVRIWTNACASRFGSGCNTTFTPCGSGWSYRQYRVKCPGIGVPDIVKESGLTQECLNQPECESSYEITNLD